VFQFPVGFTIAAAATEPPAKSQKIDKRNMLRDAITPQKPAPPLSPHKALDK